MEWSKKIDNKKYFIGTAISLAGAIYAGRASVSHCALLVSVVIASVLNQYFLFVIIARAIRRMMGADIEEKGGGFWFVLQIIGKLLVLGGVFFLLVQNARELAVLGLVLYTFQLIILILSIKNISLFFKQGNSE